MDDERIVGRSAFCRVDLLCGISIQRVSAESVDRFGREDDKPTRFDAVGGAAQMQLFGFCFSRSYGK